MEIGNDLVIDLDSTVDLNVHDMELDRNSSGPDYTLSSNGHVMERARNLPRPSPYAIEDRPRRYQTAETPVASEILNSD